MVLMATVMYRMIRYKNGVDFSLFVSQIFRCNIAAKTNNITIEMREMKSDVYISTKWREKMYEDIFCHPFCASAPVIVILIIIVIVRYSSNVESVLFYVHPFSLHALKFIY